MASFCGLISMSWPTPALSVTGLHTRRLKWSMGKGTFLFKRSETHERTHGLVCPSGRRCIQALEKSSTRPKSTRKPSFVEPQWLLPSSDADRLQASEREKAGESTSGRLWPASRTDTYDQIGALYIITISTSNDGKSGLSEPNSGILLSLIGENGRAILERIPGTELGYVQSGEGITKHFRFQRGAVDNITIVGPDLGRLAALWIAPEAGTWRLETVGVTVLPGLEELASNNKLSMGDITSLVNSGMLKPPTLKHEWKGFVHLFESCEGLLGDGAWLAAAELKPSSIHEISNVFDLQQKLLKVSPQLVRSKKNATRLREESMNEYANLKSSLLFFSSLLVAIGTVSLAIIGQDKLAEGFAVGGIGGFLYLFLLQRAVDRLPGPVTSDSPETQKDRPISNSLIEESNTPGTQVESTVIVEMGSQLPEGGSSKTLETSNSIPSGRNGGFSGRVALVAGVTLIVARLAENGAGHNISPPELLSGVAGFLTSRIAVLLAAFL